MTDLVEVLARAICPSFWDDGGIGFSKGHIEAQRTSKDRARAALAALEAAGYRVVPVEPTEAMLGEWDHAREYWEHMLAAAPKVTT